MSTAIATTEPASTEPASTETKASARERLLAAADALFYTEGINSVGVDRVIERAGVAKATLYSLFGSKEELIRAYLQERHDERAARYDRELPRFDNPRDRLLGVFDILGETAARPTFRGCAFVNASAEAKPGSAIESVSDTSRAWIRQMFFDLATDAGVPDPDGLAEELAMLYDGAVVSAKMDRNPQAAATAKTIATALVDAALAQQPS
jgi:AcrR family transcriptional regulator